MNQDMQNLPNSLAQKDKPAYESITPAGSRRYEMLYMSGRAKEKDESAPRGIPIDDFTIFATMVYAFADRKDQFRKLKEHGKKVRQIDIGTGPSLYTFIAGLPYADECIAIDIAPANIAHLCSYSTWLTPLPAYWHSWLEIAAILYDITSPNNLVTLQSKNKELYDQLRHWPTLKLATQNNIRTAIMNSLDIRPSSDNPYSGMNLASETFQKLRPLKGDVIDDTKSLLELCGTADICTRVFFAESISSNLEIMAHAELNSVLFAKQGALSVSAYMTDTSGYKGFFTPKELAANKNKIFSELPATSGLFRLLAEQLITLDDAYDLLSEQLQYSSEDQKMVRQGLGYSHATILCGTTKALGPRNIPLYSHGLQLLETVQDHIVYTPRPGDPDKHKIQPQFIYCTTAEVAALEGSETLELADSSYAPFISLPAPEAG